MSATDVETALTSEMPAPPSARPRIPSFGEPAPLFTAASDVNPRFQFASLGGKWIVLMFFGSLGHPAAKAAMDRVVARRAVFDDINAYFFGVSIDPADRSERGLKNSLPGLRYFWDFDHAVFARYGLADGSVLAPTVFLIDQSLHIVQAQPLQQIDVVLDSLEGHLVDEKTRTANLPAPILTVPRVLEPEFCRALIAYYGQTGGRSSGFMREVDGMTVAMLDDDVKKRRDVEIEDEAMRRHLCMALSYRLFPSIEKAWWWKATRIERYIVSCYTAEEGGFFRAHRDNTTAGTAHRRFAVSINLNDDFDGGDLRFPEFGSQTYRPPVGGAVVFGCSLLHEATRVTRGVRYATLPFLYDEAAAAIRDANRSKVVPRKDPPEA